MDVQGASICLPRSMSILTLSLVLALIYPIGSPYISLTCLAALVMGFPFLFFCNCSYKIKLNTQVLRVNTYRVLEQSMESTTYKSWHDSSVLYM